MFKSKFILKSLQPILTKFLRSENKTAHLARLSGMLALSNMCIVQMWHPCDLVFGHGFVIFRVLHELKFLPTSVLHLQDLNLPHPRGK